MLIFRRKSLFMGGAQQLIRNKIARTTKSFKKPFFDDQKVIKLMRIFDI